jgi:hypothetical protein
LGRLAGGVRLIRTLLERLIPGIPEGREPSAVEVVADNAMAKVVLPVLAVVPAGVVAVVPQAAVGRDQLTKPRSEAESRFRCRDARREPVTSPGSRSPVAVPRSAAAHRRFRRTPTSATP